MRGAHQYHSFAPDSFLRLRRSGSLDCMTTTAPKPSRWALSSRTGTLYVGITGYFDRRIMQHKMDTIEGFTKKYQVHRLVCYETFDHAANAISREKRLKGWRRAKKIDAA